MVMDRLQKFIVHLKLLRFELDFRRKKVPFYFVYYKTTKGKWFGVIHRLE